MKIGVVVGTFGSEEWARRGQETIERNRVCSPSTEWIHVHAEDLGTARNKGARWLTLAREVDYLVFLDADDDLDRDFLPAMRKSIYGQGIYRPSTLGVYPDGSTDESPVMIPRTHLGTANCIILGSVCPAWLFEAVGGFDPDLPALEDWDLWIKMVLAGAEVHDVPQAIYRVGVNPNSRNQNSPIHGRAYSTIRNRYRSQRGKLDIR